MRVQGDGDRQQPTASDEMTHDHLHDCERLSEYLDDDLSPAVREKVEAHIAACTDCRELHDDFVAMLRCCADFAPSPEVPHEVHEALLGLLRKAATAPE